MKVMRTGVKVEKGFLYFVDRQGDISRTRDNVGFEKVCKCIFVKTTGWFYYVDEDGDISKIKEEDAAKVKADQFDIMKSLEKYWIEIEERKKIKKRLLRGEIRKKILKEEFKGFKENTRENISEELRHEVWRRDGGKCVKCGSQENLEFDHIIPISRGGSSTARNIQILCEKCNREKSDNI